MEIVGPGSCTIWRTVHKYFSVKATLKDDKASDNW